MLPLLLPCRLFCCHSNTARLPSSCSRFFADGKELWHFHWMGCSTLQREEGRINEQQASIRNKISSAQSVWGSNWRGDHGWNFSNTIWHSRVVFFGGIAKTALFTTECLSLTDVQAQPTEVEPPSGERQFCALSTGSSCPRYGGHRSDSEISVCNQSAWDHCVMVSVAAKRRIYERTWMTFHYRPTNHWVYWIAYCTQEYTHALLLPVLHTAQCCFDE